MSSASWAESVNENGRLSDWRGPSPSNVASTWPAVWVIRRVGTWIIVSLAFTMLQMGALALLTFGTEVSAALRDQNAADRCGAHGTRLSFPTINAMPHLKAAAAAV